MALTFLCMSLVCVDMIQDYIRITKAYIDERLAYICLMQAYIKVRQAGIRLKVTFIQEI
uniref:Uncharacterized protein n=1 Tax=Candidatus Kentrum sp. MB TaxID=2138164 RepID=A0A450X8B9_9GAMM|nr:MAG: hypothetical protein BECKMB1821G_GA0114241_101434 [Candidatus Kentron sp. MB]